LVILVIIDMGEVHLELSKIIFSNDGYTPKAETINKEGVGPDIKNFSKNFSTDARFIPLRLRSFAFQFRTKNTSTIHTLLAVLLSKDAFRWDSSCQCQIFFGQEDNLDHVSYANDR